MKFKIENVSENSQYVNLNINFSNISLDEAVTVLDAIEKKLGVNLSKLDKEIVAIIKDGSLLAAVKFHKEQTGMGLKESKDYCDNLKAKYVVST